MRILLLTIKEHEGSNLAINLVKYNNKVVVKGITLTKKHPIIKLFLIVKLIFTEYGKHDVVISEDPFFNGFAGLILSKINNISLILYLKGFFPIDYADSPHPKIYRIIGFRISKLIIKKCDYIVYISMWLKEQYCEYFGNNYYFKETYPKFSVIHHGPNPIFINKTKIRKDSSNIKLLYVGNLRFRGKSKGVSLILQSYCRLSKLYPHDKIMLYVIGGGIYLSGLIEEAYNLGIDQKVIFTGKIDQLKLVDFYLSSDIFIYVSYQDACPTVVLEAQTSGLPVIVTRTSGAAELVEDGITGLICEPTITDLTRSIMSLINDPIKRSKLGNNAVNHIKENFTWGYAAKKFNELMTYILLDSKYN